MNRCIANPGESIDCFFHHRGIPLAVYCRLLEYGFTDRLKIMEHSHPGPPFARLFVFHRGGAEVELPDAGRHVTLRPGIIYLLPPGLSFDIRYGVSQLIYFHLHIGDAAGRPVFDTVREILSLADPILLKQFRASIFDDARWAALAAIVWALGVWLEPRFDELARRSEEARQFARLFEYLRHTPPGRVSVKELAEVEHLTPDALSKRFARVFKMPLSHYLADVRMRRARELVLHSELSIGEIARELGFADSQYFQRFFKQHDGVTPGNYRRLRREI